MADDKTPKTDLDAHDDGAPDMSPAGHLAMAKAHMSAAGDHMDAMMEGGENEPGADGARGAPAGSAQQRAFRYPAGSGAARALRQATGGRRG